MVRWRRTFFLASLLVGGALASAVACGPFLYENAELDHFSLLEPGIINTREWDRFLDFGSPAFGQKVADASGESKIAQLVIHSERTDTATPDDVTNLFYDQTPGADALTVAANEAWWADYFAKVRHRNLSSDELQKVLYGPDRPQWLDPADVSYLTLLDGAADRPEDLALALAGARNPKYPEGLRHRFAFWAVRALALAKDPDTMKVFREFCPGVAPDLPLARAQGWAASVLVDSNSAEALALWVDLFVLWPDTRVQTFSSLSTLDASAWTGIQSPGALVAKFFVTGRDFSPETLRAVAEAEQKGGTDGAWTEAVLYAMAEQVEREAGVFALFGLVDPTEVSPKGLFTGLIDEAQSLAEKKVVAPTRTWWLLASYLSLFDGDEARAAQFLDRARTLPARNPAQDHQTDLIAALLQMGIEKDKDWSAGLQTQVVDALHWGQTLNAVDHNRGLYHSVVVLAAQKELARGHNPQAALAFGLIQGGGSNPYQVASDDGFWSTSGLSNDSVNLLMDALMTDDDIDGWRALLHSKNLSPLTAHLVANSLLTDRDLTWWQAHRALRRGQGEKALALLKNLGPAPTISPDATVVFPDRKFTYSLDLDPLDPASGRGARTVTPATLASLMSRIETEAQTKASSRALLNRGMFWFSLQLSGMPLLFAQPPTLISFTNGNFEYYGYDGNDTNRSTSVVGTFPLGRPSRTDAWARRLNEFYRNEFSTLGRAKAAFEAVVARQDDPEAEYKALLFLQALGEDQYSALANHRYDGLELADTFRTTCEEFRSRAL